MSPRIGPGEILPLWSGEDTVSDVWTGVGFMAVSLEAASSGP